MKEAASKRKRFRDHFSLRIIFTLLTMADIISTIVLAWMLTEVLDTWFDVTRVVPTLFWIIVISIVIGGTITNFLTIQFFEPITKLNQAMNQVAERDFSVRLETKTRFKDIRDIYANFNLMAQELETTEVLQTDFISGVSHEFKTPINAIEGYATLLQSEDETPPEERRRYVDKILLNTRRLSNLIGSVLLLSKVDNQAIPEKQTKFRLDEQIRQVVLMLESEWVKKDIEFDIQLDRIEYTGNEAFLSHVWSNLIGNAIKFDPIGGSITMRLRKEERGAVFVIEDSGPGVSEDIKKHIFDKFYQGDTSHKDEGNGLGLAIVKHILASCQGSIEVENIPTGGCRFTVVLP